MPKKLLLADDEPGILALVSATLGEDRRFTTSTARDGLEALRVAQRERPDVLLLDVRMPKMDGVAVCRALRKDPSNAHMKIVMLSANVQATERRRGLEAGADDYLVKPFSPKALIQKLEEMLGLEQQTA